MSRLDYVSLKNCRDEWRWNNDAGDLFSAKQLSSVESDRGNTASKDGLVHRGVPLPDTLCPRYGIQVENPNHIFISCLWAKSIWWNIVTWMRNSFPSNCNSLKELIDFLKECPGSKVWKRMVYTVCMATVWRIWGARNLKTFEDTFVPVRETVEFIKEDVFFWINNRTKFKDLSWENRIDFNVVNLL
ncbi:hypothetical protein HanLR1_Chr01g0026421 [Helianthus annuus]|nr:hypothetical protein HanHA89_Chr01g0027841 [Helianthus annuus]KAJ0783918.1 hypothetical protein HanLR1_Chr01g0026421 [Helianthus annuus]